ncbi:MAG: EamA family transporter [Bacteroidetes bacterium]|nr:EamA family transporter [Bacteroidota bacterium]
MIYLLLTILLNTVIFVLFKLFPKYNINALQAIVVNYITCVITGSIFLGRFPISAHSVQQSWFPVSLLMGTMYISIFNFIAYCTKKYGVTTASVANKLSLVIPVLFSVAVYHDKLTIVNIIGIVLALPAVYLTTRVEGEKANMHGVLLPALLFLFSGTLDSMTKYVGATYLPEVEQQAIYPIHVFAVAASLGIIITLVLLLQKRITFSARSVVAGVVLGIPNYFSIYYLIRFLNDKFMPSSSAIAINNIGIVLCSALLAIIVFKESTTNARLLGLILSVVSIILIALNIG